MPLRKQERQVPRSYWLVDGTSNALPFRNFHVHQERILLPSTYPYNTHSTPHNIHIPPQRHNNNRVRRDYISNRISQTFNEKVLRKKRVLPSSQTPFISRFLLFHNNLLRGTLLVLHLPHKPSAFHFIISSQCRNLKLLDTRRVEYDVYCRVWIIRKEELTGGP